MSDPNMVTISLEEYAGLIEDRKFLGALQSAGVDNWEGYSMAFRYLEDEDYDGE